MDAVSIATRSIIRLSRCCGAGSRAQPMPTHSGCSTLGGQGRGSSPGWAPGALVSMTSCGCWGSRGGSGGSAEVRVRAHCWPPSPHSLRRGVTSARAQAKVSQPWLSVEED